MVKELSAATVARMDPMSRAKYDSLPDEVDEEPREGSSEPSRNGVCSSLEEALATPAAEGVRYHSERIVGTGLKFRFRSLSTEEWLSVAETNAEILEHSLCDSNGHTFVDSEGLALLKKRFDARSYAHLKLVAEHHCFCGMTLEGLREAAAKNSAETDTTSTS
jgi:hypothetical protein